MAALRPLFEAPAVWILALDALAIWIVWLVARVRGVGRAPIVLRILAVVGLVVPGFTIFDWYRDLAEARDWARDLPVRSEAIVERFAISSVTLTTVGFLVLVAGIYLARRLEAGRSPSEGGSP